MSTAPERRPLRLFFALWPDDGVRAALAAASDRLRKVCSGRPTAAENLHMTLAFLGDVPAARLRELQIMAAGLDAHPLVLTLDCFGWWRSQRVVWAGMTACPRELEMLAAGFADRLRANGFRAERRRFKPHVTLLRDVRRSPAPEELESLRWNPADFVLVSSEQTTRGVRYRIVDKWPLHGSAGL